jgi:hypothetical protein
MFATSIFPTGSVSTLTSGVTSAIGQNIGAILGVLAFIVGLSIVMAIFDASKEPTMPSRFDKWK